MGIGEYYPFLKFYHPSIFVDCNGKTVFDVILFDTNYVLHYCSYSSKNESDYDKVLYGFLNDVLTKYIGTKHIIFAIDGPSTYSKIPVQRKRRFGMSLDNHTDQISSVHLTPGSTFMKKIVGLLKIFIENFKKKLNHICPKFTIIPSEIKDEGEIKILQKIIEIGNNSDYDNPSFLIIGNDADIISLSVASCVNNIYILKDKKNGTMISVNNLVISHHNKINEENPISNIEDIDKQIKQNISVEFSLISTLMGNDYLPKLRGVGYKKLWNVYLSSKKSTNFELVDPNNCLNIQGFQIFVHSIYKSLTKKFKQYEMTEYDGNNISSYLDGLAWCVTMYNTGSCPKYDYSHCNYIGIHPKYISLYLSYIESPQINKILPPSSNVEPLHSDIYGLILIHKQAKDLIPENMHKVMRRELKWLYYDNCIICKKIRRKVKILNYRINKLKGVKGNFDKLSELSEKHKYYHKCYKIHQERDHNHNLSLDDIATIKEHCEKYISAKKYSPITIY